MNFSMLFKSTCQRFIPIRHQKWYFPVKPFVLFEGGQDLERFALTIVFTILMLNKTLCDHQCFLLFEVGHDAERFEFYNS